jgi:hypothetical protein
MAAALCPRFPQRHDREEDGRARRVLQEHRWRACLSHIAQVVITPNPSPPSCHRARRRFFLHGPPADGQRRDAAPPRPVK